MPDKHAWRHRRLQRRSPPGLDNSVDRALVPGKMSVSHGVAANKTDKTCLRGRLGSKAKPHKMLRRHTKRQNSRHRNPPFAGHRVFPYASLRVPQSYLLLLCV